MRDAYDPYSAVTFLMLGLGIGAVVAIVCSPRVQQAGGLELERTAIGARRDLNHEAR